MKDGLNNQEEWSEDLLVQDDVSGTGLDLYASGATIANAKITTLSGTNVLNSDGLVSAVGTGSPSLTFGRLVQAGVGATGAGSNAWHTFASTFGAIPTAILVCPTETAEAFVCPAGSWGAGSFYVETASASQDFSWAAFE